jgi:hypothetical protein
MALVIEVRHPRASKPTEGNTEPGVFQSLEIFDPVFPDRGRLFSKAWTFADALATNSKKQIISKRIINQATLLAE